MRKQLGDAACWGLPAGEGRSFLEDPAEEELGEENSDLELILCEENSDLDSPVRGVEGAPFWFWFSQL